MQVIARIVIAGTVESIVAYFNLTINYLQVGYMMKLEIKLN